MLLAAGNTANIENAIYTNPVGALMFEALWTGPEFDASVCALYFVLFLEISNPR